MSKEEEIVAAPAPRRRRGGGRGGAGAARSGAQPVYDGARLIYKHAFGVNGPIRNNVEFTSESTIIFPVGQHVVTYHLEEREMAFLQKNRSVRSILAMCTAPKHKVVAICEQARAPDDETGSAQVSVYHVTTHYKMRTMTFQTRGEFSNCAFSDDGKHLVTVCDSEPDFTLVYWKWEAEKVMASIAVGTAVSRVRVNPANPSLVTTSGLNHLRQWTLTQETQFRMAALLPLAREQENWVDHVWINATRLVAISDQGSVMVLDALAVAQSGPGGLSAMAGANAAGGVATMEVRQALTCSNLAEGARLETLAAYGKGFVVAGSGGFFAVYEKTDDRKDPYLLIKTFSAGEEAFGSLAVSPTDETVVAYMRNNHLMSFALGSIDILSENENHFHEVVPNGIHMGAVSGMDVCLHKPIVITCGAKDKTIRVWDYVRWQCELVHNLSEEPTSVAVHPSGFQVLVGFRERVRLYNLLMEGLRPFREMALKNVREVRFSTGGHMFACAIGISIMVFNTYSFESLFNFTGHISPVRRLLWAPDDRTLYSAGQDGGVYAWSLTMGTRIEDMQHVEKGCSYSGLAAGRSEPHKPDSRCVMVACGSDGQIREISPGDRNGDKTKEFAVGTSCLTVLALSHSNRFLFAGTTTGHVRVYPWPLEPEYQEYALHNSPVTSLHVSTDDLQLFSTGEDGSVFALGIQQVERGADVQALATDLRQFNLEVVLVAREEVEENALVLKDMRKKVDDMRSDMDYQLHRIEAKWSENMKKQKEEMESQLQAERLRYEELENRYEAFVREAKEDVEKREADHVQVTQQLENQYEHKLAMEMERFDRLSEEMEAMRQQCEGLLEAQDQKHAQMLKEQRSEAQRTIKEQSEKIKQLQEDLKYNEIKFEQVLTQQEEEYERELRQLREAAENELSAERQNTAVKEGLLSAKKNRYEQLRKKMTELRTASHARDILYMTEKAKNKKLEETLVHLEAHMREREASLAEKEKTILGLRATNRTLDNFRYVLDHRLQQLNEEKGPIVEHTEKLEAHIRDMYEELVTEFHQKKTTDTTIAAKDLKISTLTNEVLNLRNLLREKERYIGSFSRELSHMVNLSTPKDIEDAVKDAYRKYVRNEKPRRKAASRRAAAAAAGNANNRGPQGGGGGGNQNQNQNPGQGQGQGGDGQGGGGGGGGGGGQSDGQDQGQDDGQGGGQGNQGGGGGGQGNQGGGGGGWDDDDDAQMGGGVHGGMGEQESVEEANRQRDYMQKTVITLKRNLKNTKFDAAHRSKLSMEENSLLIQECNRLRQENRRFRQKIFELDSKAARAKKLGRRTASGRSLGAATSDEDGDDTLGEPVFQRRAETPLAGAGPGPGGRRASRPSAGSTPSTAVGMPRSMTTSHLPPAGLGVGSPGLGRARTATPSGSRTRVVRGSTRPLVEGSEQRMHISALQTQLDDTSREREMQRMEIKRLREQVQLLVAQLPPDSDAVRQHVAQLKSGGFISP